MAVLLKLSYHIIRKQLANWLTPSKRLAKTISSSSTSCLRYGMLAHRAAKDRTGISGLTSRPTDNSGFLMLNLPFAASHKAAAANAANQTILLG
jgi:hypothetical protein